MSARVAVVFGSVMEQEVMTRVGAMLARFGVEYDETMISPHRAPRALLAMTSMSAGVPVAVVGLDHSTNAAVLAVQILAVNDTGLRTQLAQFKETFEQAAVTQLD